MIEVKWTSKASVDLVRLFECLAPANKPAAIRTVRTLTAAPAGLPAHPRIGERLEEFDPRDARRILIGHYEIQKSSITVLRLWHTREGR